MKNSLAPEPICETFYKQDKHYNLRCGEFPIPNFRMVKNGKHSVYACDQIIHLFQSLYFIVHNYPFISIFVFYRTYSRKYCFNALKDRNFSFVSPISFLAKSSYSLIKHMYVHMYVCMLWKLKSSTFLIFSLANIRSERV